jgi:ATP-dependent Clp protease adaptor protein ClpS
MAPCSRLEACAARAGVARVGVARTGLARAGVAPVGVARTGLARVGVARAAREALAGIRTAARAETVLRTSWSAGTPPPREATASTGTLTPPQERLRHGGGRAGDEPWKVIVLNDNHNTFNGVAAALAAVLPGVTFERGLALANQIHNRGRAIVWSGHKERAEHYRSQLEARGLTMAPLEQ